MNGAVRAFGCAAVCAVVVVSGHAQEKAVPAATDRHGAFAFSDEKGARLLVMPNVAQSRRLTSALCSGGRRVTVRFEKRQPERKNNGRHTPANFDSLGGAVFAVTSGRVDPAAICLLATDQLLKGSAPLALSALAKPDACGQPDRFASLRSRPVVRCWTLGRGSSDQEVALLEFERRGKDALASLAIADGARTVLADFPAVYLGSGQDLWRVEDGGELSPDGFDVVWVLRRNNEYTVAVAWHGTEGVALSLWTSDRDRLTQVIGDYWYRMPLESPPPGGRTCQMLLNLSPHADSVRTEFVTHDRDP